MTIGSAAVFGGLITTSSSALFTILVIIWLAVWGVVSLAVIAVWRRPRLPWLALGVVGPVGPLVALLVGLVAHWSDSDD